MRRLQSAVGSWNLTGLDSGKAEGAVLGGGNSSEAAKGGIDRLDLSVFGMRIAAVGIGLPELEQCIGNSLTVRVENFTGDFDFLAGSC